MAHIREAGVSTEKLDNLFGKDFPTAVQFKKALSERLLLLAATQAIIMSAAEIDEMGVTSATMDRLNNDWFTIEQRKATANQLGLQIDKSRAEISEAKVTIGFLQEKQKQMNTKKSELNFEIEIIKAKRLELEEEKEQIKAELTCSNCKIFVGKNIRSLNAHVGKCK